MAGVPKETEVTAAAVRGKKAANKQIVIGNQSDIHPEASSKCTSSSSSSSSSRSSKSQGGRYPCQIRPRDCPLGYQPPARPLRLPIHPPPSPPPCEFGCQEDMMFCGIFDGHGPWGHFVAKRIRETMPPSLLCSWQETLAQTSLYPDLDLELDKKGHQFNIWKHSYIKTCAGIDQELEQHRRIDSFYIGTIALSIVRQGDLIFIANVGDSRAVLATTSEDGSLVPVRLTVDFKPSLPQEAERIIQSKGSVFCLDDEPGVQRVWQPDGETPGLVMSRAFGDYCVKGFGLISVPEVTQRNITSRDQFVVLATDGVRNELESCRKECKVLRERLTSCEEMAGQKTRRFIYEDWFMPHTAANGIGIGQGSR